MVSWTLANKLNTLRPRQNGRHFPDDIFKWIFLNENVWISISISLKFVPRDPINNIPTLVQVMAWRRPGDKPLSEPMMVRLPTHICVTRPQWVKWNLNQNTAISIEENSFEKGGHFVSAAVSYQLLGGLLHCMMYYDQVRFMMSGYKYCLSFP